jgi:hypothetical protein
MGEEQLRCNICEVIVSVSQAKGHASTPSHESRRSQLEQELKDIRKANYTDDSSVIVVWENSI